MHSETARSSPWQPQALIGSIYLLSFTPHLLDNIFNLRVLVRGSNVVRRIKEGFNPLDNVLLSSGLC